MKYLLHLCISVLILTSCGSGQSQGVTKVDKTALQEMLDNDPQIILLDVRTPDEVANGKINDALNLDWYEDSFKSSVEKLDKSKPVVVYCMSGMRSAAASEFLLTAGFEKVYDLDGGYLSWIE
jgi:rhodanese-related sulfurtransferase